jgi:RNA-directed DNA polymerase
VVHHALVGVMEPHFERRFVAHSYACRVGKGTHRALRRALHLSRIRRYVLKGDVVKFFPSVDHEVVLGEVARVIADERVLALTRQVVGGACPQEPVLAWYPGDDLFEPAVRRRGLPIGNLTSQFLANVLLDRLDHAVMDGMGCGDYVRYCDDFLVFGDDAAALWRVRQGIECVLAGLRLSLHERKGGVHATRGLISFLGFTLRQGACRMQRQGVVRATRRLRTSVQAARRGELAAATVRSRLAAWIGHAQHASSARVVTAVLARAGLPDMLTEAAIRKRLWPCVARRQLEQQLQQLPRVEPQQQHARQPQQQHRVSSREHAAR